jgi:hypothetical protein
MTGTWIPRTGKIPKKIPILQEDSDSPTPAKIPDVEG